MRFSTVLTVSATAISAIKVNYENLHAHQWRESSPYKSSKWRDQPGQEPYRGDIVQIDATAKPCPTMDLAYFDTIAGGSGASGVGTTDQAQFLRPDPSYTAPFAYNVTAGFTDAGFDKFPPLGHGVYCPTTDPSFFYNEEDDSYIWHNSVNNQWSMGKPSVEWWFTVDASSPRGPEKCVSVDPATLPLCPEGKDAGQDLNAPGCPKCITKNGRGPEGGHCTLEMIRECLNPNTPEGAPKDPIPECAPGKRPARDFTSCCPTCYIAPGSCTVSEGEVPCAGVSNPLPVCATILEVADAYDPANCCFTCVRGPATAPATTAADCTPAEIDTCIAETPVCLDLEEPKLGSTEGHCCDSCKRAGRQYGCTPEGVAKCVSAQPDCAANEVPQIVDGECCLSCKNIEDQSATSDAVERAVAVTDAKTDRLALFKELDAQEVITAVKEVAERYCDLPTADRKAECAQLDDLALKVTVASASQAKFNVRVAKTGEDLLKNALKDEMASAGLTFTVDETPFPIETPLAAAAVATPVGLACMLFSLLIVV